MKLLGIIGGPATGKTTLMNRVFSDLGITPKTGDLLKTTSSTGELPLGTVIPSKKTIVLGFYEDGEIYQGTDRLSMAIAPTIPPFFKKHDEYHDHVVLFEGSRLTSTKFYQNMRDINIGAELGLVLLETEMGDGGLFGDDGVSPGTVTRKERMAIRKSNQDPTWVTGRDSAATNMFGSISNICKFAKKFTHNTPEDTVNISKEIVSWLQG